MLVFKFGGASVKDASAVQNVRFILQKYAQENLLVVISAMGKTTNLLEDIYQAIYTREASKFDQSLAQCIHFHHDIIGQLFAEGSEKDQLLARLEKHFDFMRAKWEALPSENRSYEYDQIVSLGEVMSTEIVSAYLQAQGDSAQLLDARKLVRTDHKYQDGGVDWHKTEELIKQAVSLDRHEVKIYITQGFIGHTSEGFTCTLGREGSDYSAAIFAYCLGAEQVTIWKDVPGMLNADPKQFENTVKLDKISFKEALELAYYGASVIHPKTIKPLQNKNIPLYVKSFLDPDAEGTTIQNSQDYDSLVPSYISKKKQVLFSINPKDFSFIMEENLGTIFQTLAELGAKLNLMQNSALSFSFIVDSEKTDIDALLKAFQEHYEVRFNDELELLTIRHYTPEIIETLCAGKEIILQQKTRQTARIILKAK